MQNILHLVTVIKGKGNNDLYFIKQWCWLLCKQKWSDNLNTPGDISIIGLVVFYRFQVYFRLWTYAESRIWFQWESKHSRLIRDLQFSSHYFSILLNLNWHPSAPDWKCYSEMSYREQLQQICALTILSQTIGFCSNSVLLAWGSLTYNTRYYLTGIQN